MSELRADTITGSDGSSPVTLTKQSAATARHTYDQVDSTTIDSLNISTATDVSTGLLLHTFSNAYSSAIQRQVIVNAWNTNNDGTGSVASDIRGLDTSQHNAANTTTTVRTKTSYGSSSASNGAATDTNGHYAVIFGDLA
jgi:hypothetical protein